MEAITHGWLISKGFQHHPLTKIELYKRDGCTYVYMSGDEFGLKIQNNIFQKQIEFISDFIEFHRILSGVKLN